MRRTQIALCRIFSQNVCTFGIGRISWFGKKVKMKSPLFYKLERFKCASIFVYFSIFYTVSFVCYCRGKKVDTVGVNGLSEIAKLSVDSDRFSSISYRVVRQFSN